MPRLSPEESIDGHGLAPLSALGGGEGWGEVGEVSQRSRAFTPPLPALSRHPLRPAGGEGYGVGLLNLATVVDIEGAIR